MLNMEMLWKDYCTFEYGINPIIAKKMQEDRGRDYMNARRVSKEYEVVTKGLNKNAPSVPPQNSPDEIKQVQLWKNYIQWEKSNPLRTEDTTLITKRVIFAYEQCLLCLGHHPDIWIEAALYLEQASKLLSEKGADVAGKVFADEASALYERATTTVLKNCVLLYFAYADFEESRLKFDKVHTIYKRLLEIQENDPTLCYIQYMRFARRAEGIKSARTVFKMAREDSRTTYQLYVAAALMEYYCSKDSSIALKIFELALKRYGMQPECVREYIDYMSHLNEDNNTRVLFERVLSSGQLPSEKSRDIWNRFLEFEANIGDLTSIVKVEKRRAQSFGSDAEGKETALLIDRYKYIDLFPLSSSEIKAVGYGELYRQQLSTTVSASQDFAKALPMSASEEETQSFPRPDVLQMIPFKPRIVVAADAHPVPGGIFPPPPAAADLLLKLPPPYCFTGPFVITDKFIEHMMNLKLPEDPSKMENGIEPRTADPGTQLSIDIALGRKRRIEQSTNDDSDDEGAQAPPVNDIYRQRQQKKVK
jgi:cleavage stimulation factor subunit 3